MLCPTLFTPPTAPDQKCNSILHSNPINKPSGYCEWPCQNNTCSPAQSSPLNWLGASPSSDQLPKIVSPDAEIGYLLRSTTARSPTNIGCTQETFQIESDKRGWRLTLREFGQAESSASKPTPRSKLLQQLCLLLFVQQSWGQTDISVTSVVAGFDGSIVRYCTVPVSGSCRATKALVSRENYIYNSLYLC